MKVVHNDLLILWRCYDVGDVVFRAGEDIMLHWLKIRTAFRDLGAIREPLAASSPWGNDVFAVLLVSLELVRDLLPVRCHIPKSPRDYGVIERHPACSCKVFQPICSPVAVDSVGVLGVLCCPFRVVAKWRLELGEGVEVDTVADLVGQHARHRVALKYSVTRSVCKCNGSIGVSRDADEMTLEISLRFIHNGSKELYIPDIRAHMDWHASKVVDNILLREFGIFVTTHSPWLCAVIVLDIKDAEVIGIKLELGCDLLARLRDVVIIPAVLG